MSNMGKDFLSDEMEAKVNNGKQILTVSPRLSLPDVMSPAMTIDEKSSYVQLRLKDYSQGKGDQSKNARYNLDLKTVRFIKRALDAGKTSFDYKGNKLHGKYPEKAGPFAGLCPYFSIWINRSETDQNGRIKKYPWYIQIENGYAKAARGRIEGTFYAEKGSFRSTSKVGISCNDEDLGAIIDAYCRYEEAFVNSEEAKKRFEEAQAKKRTYEGNKDSSYKPSADNTEKSGNYQNSTANTPATASLQAPVKAESTQAAQPQAKKSLADYKTTRYEAEFTSDFSDVKGKKKARLKIRHQGKDYGVDCFFGKTPKEIIDIFVKKQKFTADFIRDDNGNVWFSKLVSVGEADVLPVKDAGPAPQVASENKTKQAPVKPEELHEAEIRIIDEDFIRLEDGVVANCLINDKPYAVSFDQVTPEMEKLVGDNGSMKVLLYAVNGKIRCWCSA